MALIETSPDSARSDLSMKYLFTSKNLTHRQKLYRWVVIGCWVVMGYACVAVIVFNDDWGQWRFYGGFAAMGLPLLVLFFSLRFVWALLRRLVLVAVGRVGSSPAGGRAPGSVAGPLLGLGFIGCVLWLVGYISFMYQWSYVEDARQGSVRHENVICQNFRVGRSTGKNSHAQYVFDLVSEDGFSWTYRMRRSSMDDKVEKGEEPYASVMSTCRGETSGLGIVVYEHSGIITEAWTNQAGSGH